MVHLTFQSQQTTKFFDSPGKINQNRVGITEIQFRRSNMKTETPVQSTILINKVPTIIHCLLHILQKASLTVTWKAVEVNEEA